MGYGDFTPSGGYHPKKPLTRAQLRKMRDAYSQANTISQKVKELEELEKKDLSPTDLDLLI